MNIKTITALKHKKKNEIILNTKRFQEEKIVKITNIENQTEVTVNLCKYFRSAFLFINIRDKNKKVRIPAINIAIPNSDIKLGYFAFNSELGLRVKIKEPKIVRTSAIVDNTVVKRLISSNLLIASIRFLLVIRIYRHLKV